MFRSAIIVNILRTSKVIPPPYYNINKVNSKVINQLMKYLQEINTRFIFFNNKSLFQKTAND